MKQQDESIFCSIEAFEKIKSQFHDIKDGDVKRTTEVLIEAIGVVEQCIQTLGNNHSHTVELYYMIGVMYYDLKNYSQSVKWFTKGANHGDEASECELALMYQCGKGVKQDLGKAIDLYTQAALKGNETATVISYKHNELENFGCAEDEDETANTDYEETKEPEIVENSDDSEVLDNNEPRKTLNKEEKLFLILGILIVIIGSIFFYGNAKRKLQEVIGENLDIGVDEEDS